MSIKVMSEVWEHAPVTQGTLLVLLALADAADEGTRRCFPGIARLAKFSRLQERQVHNCLRELRDAGIVLVDRGKGPAGTNIYTITKASAWGVQKLHPLQSSAGAPATHCTPDLQPIAPKPSEEPSEEPSDLFGSIEPQRAREAEKPKTDGFEDFWKVYPKKAAKADAEKAWRKAITIAPAEVIIAAAARYADWLNSAAPGEFRPQVKFPQGWLNGRRWEDPDIAPVQRRARLHPPPHEEVFR